LYLNELNIPEKERTICTNSREQLLRQSKYFKNNTQKILKFAYSRCPPKQWDRDALYEGALLSVETAIDTYGHLRDIFRDYGEVRKSNNLSSLNADLFYQYFDHWLTLSQNIFQELVDYNQEHMLYVYKEDQTP